MIILVLEIKIRGFYNSELFLKQLTPSFYSDKNVENLKNTSATRKIIKILNLNAKFQYYFKPEIKDLYVLLFYMS